MDLDIEGEDFDTVGGFVYDQLGKTDGRMAVRPGACPTGLGARLGAPTGTGGAGASDQDEPG